MDSVSEHPSPPAPSVEVSRPEAKPDPKKARARWKKWALRGAILTPFLGMGAWVAVHRIPWLGPLVANSLRATIGSENVTALEDFVYGIEDDINQVVRSDEKPQSRWQVPAAPPQAKETDAAQAVGAAGGAEDETGEPREKPLAPFAPPVPGPVHEAWAAEGDGQWVPLIDPRHPDESPAMFKTLLHPDRNRSWAELFVVAVDLRQVEVHPVVGYQEPRTEKPEAADYERFAKIPPEAYPNLIAAFNGGFMAEHGGYGMMMDGITFLDPKDNACTLAHYDDGSYRVGTWSKLIDSASADSDMLWYRQAPNCMYEGGKLNPLLAEKRARKWGATLDGNTVIRRSAVGLDETGQILYVGITNHTTARVLADGMHHVGAVTVAQMDVNWSYPKFVTYEPRGKEGLLYPVALADGFEFSEHLYLRERSMRDFFYLTRHRGAQVPGTKKAPAVTKTAASSSSAKAPDATGADVTEAD